MLNKIVASFLLVISSVISAGAHLIPSSIPHVSNTPAVSTAVSINQVPPPVVQSAAPVQKTTAVRSVPVSANVAALRDAAIKSQIDSIIVNAALYKDSSGSYGKDLHADCSNALSPGSVFSDPLIKSVLQHLLGMWSAKQTCTVYGNGTSFAISAELVSDTTEWYCRDSSGIALVTSGDTLVNSGASCK